MPSAAAEHYGRTIDSIRSVFRSREAAVILLAIAVGIVAGLLTILIHELAHGLQSIIYGISDESLSASSTVPFVRLLALPLAGLLLGFGSRAAIRRWRT